jgi:drug/metabolite transporter (DMT)-like permease
LFATALAVAVLGESIRLRRLLGLAFGFAGALVVVRPGVIDVDIGAALTVGSAALWGGTMIIIKVLSRTESSVKITIYMALMGTPLALLAALPFWRAPTLGALGLMALAGALGSLAHVALAQAFKQADVTAMLPVDFMRLVWAAVFGFIFFAEVPEVWTWLGGAMVFSAVVYIAYREKQAVHRVDAGNDRARAPPDAPRDGR